MKLVLNVMQEVFERTRISVLGLELGAVPSSVLKETHGDILGSQDANAGIGINLRRNTLIASMTL